jgi:ATP synthase protein I
MTDDSGERPPTTETKFSAEVGKQAARKLRAQAKANKSIWFGFGMSGLIGWSVAVPALLGALLGIWLDARYPGAHSWTLALLAAGLVFGCWNAWHWVDNEDKAMKDDTDE